MAIWAVGKPQATLSRMRKPECLFCHKAWQLATSNLRQTRLWETNRLMSKMTKAVDCRCRLRQTLNPARLAIPLPLCQAIEPRQTAIRLRLLHQIKPCLRPILHQLRLQIHLQRRLLREARARDRRILRTPILRRPSQPTNRARRRYWLHRKRRAGDPTIQTRLAQQTCSAITACLSGCSILTLAPMSCSSSTIR